MSDQEGAAQSKSKQRGKYGVTRVLMGAEVPRYLALYGAFPAAPSTWVLAGRYEVALDYPGRHELMLGRLLGPTAPTTPATTDCH